jgi:hypothetical protein
VEKALQDKRSIVIRAEGDAESARMISEAVQSNPYYLELKTIEAARDIAGSLANSQNKVYLSSDMLMFNLLSSISGYAWAPPPSTTLNISAVGPVPEATLTRPCPSRSSTASSLVGSVLSAKDATIARQ